MNCRPVRQLCVALMVGLWGLAAAAGTTDLAAARAQVAAGHAAAALSAYVQAVAADPGNADLLIEAARVHGFADRNREAATLYRQALLAAPSRRADVLPSLAWQTLWSGEPDAARVLFDELVVTGADRADALDGLGQARLALGDNPGGQDALRQALALRPGDARLRRRLARALSWDGRADEAVAVLSPAQDRDSAWLLASVRNLDGHHQTALADFTRLGPPAGNGERLDLARALAWAGFEDQALPLLAGQTDPEAVWLRDWRLAREGSRYAFGGLESSLDRDGLHSLALVVGAGLRPQPGATLELRTRRLQLREGAAGADGQDLQAQYRWRVGEPGAAWGALWPTVTGRVDHYRNGQKLLGGLRGTWLPRDGWRLDAEWGRERIETPQAIAEGVTVDVGSLGLDRQFSPRWSASTMLAMLHFDDGNRRNRWRGQLAYALTLQPRWTVGADATWFESTQPSGPQVPGRGYWNPRRYDETRVFTTLRWERRPWDAYLRLSLGRSNETDGWNNCSQGRPDQWELGLGHDLSATLRVSLSVGGSGSGMGLGSGGTGYWRRAGSLMLVGWF